MEEHAESARGRQPRDAPHDAIPGIAHRRPGGNNTQENKPARHTHSCASASRPADVEENKARSRRESHALRVLTTGLPSFALLLTCWSVFLHTGTCSSVVFDGDSVSSAFFKNGSHWLSGPFGEPELAQRRILSAVSCPLGFAGAGADCLPCTKNLFTGKCDVECDMFVNCSGHGHCDGLTASCSCYDGWGGANCGKRTVCDAGFTGFPKCDMLSRLERAQMQRERLFPLPRGFHRSRSRVLAVH